jgi:hypothetical protein
MDLKKLKQKSELIPDIIPINRRVDIQIWKFDLTGEVDNQNLKDKILQYRKENPESWTSNVYAWHTPFKTHRHTDIFKDIVDLITQKSNSALVTHQFYRYDVDECWAAIYEENDYTGPHKHLPNPYAFVYYVEADNNSSPLIFEENYIVHPKTGMLVVFSGDATHFVPKVTGNNRRIVIAGNLLYLPKDVVRLNLSSEEFEKLSKS